MLTRNVTAAPTAKAAPALFDQLEKSLKGPEGAELIRKVKGLIVFDIDGEQWTLDAREGSGQLYQGRPKGGDKPDLTLTLSDENFAKLVAGKLNPQQAFLMRKLKINGAMGLAMKLTPVLEAAAPKAKL